MAHAEGKVAIDPSGALPDGRQLAGPDALKSVLRESKDAFAACITEKLMIYALGRGLERGDEPAVRKVVQQAAAGGYRISDLILGIVTSEPFLERGER